MTNEKSAVLLFKTNIWIFEAAYLIGINKGELKISVTLLVKFSNLSGFTVVITFTLFPVRRISFLNELLAV